MGRRGQPRGSEDPSCEARHDRADDLDRVQRFTVPRGAYGAPTSVLLSAADPGGSGIAKILYTTDGTDPTATSAIYSSPLSRLSATTTVKYRAIDVAGNVEATK